MKIVQPHHIKAYSECPRKALNTWDKPRVHLSFECQVLSSVIKAAHLYRAKSERIPSWKRVMGYLDKFHQRAIQQTKGHVQAEYSMAVKMLHVLQNWYDRIFIAGGSPEGLINVPVFLELGSNVIYNDTVPLVLFENNGNTIAICDFFPIANQSQGTINNIYNDMIVHARTWAFFQATNKMPKKYIRYFLSPGLINPRIIYTRSSMIQSASKTMKHILSGIKDQVFYPSFSTQCTACPFAGNCII